MSTTTDYLALTMLELSDSPPDITRLNRNWSSIDSHIRDLEVATSKQDNDLSEIKSVNDTQNQRLSDLESLASHVAVGTYVGDGSTMRYINLGFSPRAVMVFSQMPEPLLNNTVPKCIGIALKDTSWDGQSTEDPQAYLEECPFLIVAGALLVKYLPDAKITANTLRHTYIYVAIK